MKRIGLLVFPGFQILDLVAVTVFELANSVADGTQYDIHVLSEAGGLVRSSSGVKIDTEDMSNAGFDTLLVAGSSLLADAPPRLVTFLQDVFPRTRRLGSICTGAFLLAEAGLLDGRRATTHWYFARELQQRYPRIKVEEDRIYTTDGTIWTSAGMTACIDLALALVDEDLGAVVARTVARKLVIYHRRTGGQSQFSALLELEPKSNRIQDALSHAKQHLHQKLSVNQLAEVAHLSPRQFSRACLKETGHSPARVIERLRVESARTMIEAGGQSVEHVARLAGFADPERMRRAFHRALGRPPQSLKQSGQGRNRWTG